MKKTLLIALLLIPFLGISQTAKPIDGFLGIKFGASKADIMAAMKARGATFLEKNSDEKMLSFSDVKLGSRSAAQFNVFFVNEKAWQALFAFTADQEPQTVEYYNALVSDISDVYGKGNSTRSFKSPYEDGDGHEILALAGGYAQLRTFFSRDNAYILVEIATSDDKLFVLTRYIDKTLQAEDKAKAKADF